MASTNPRPNGARRRRKAKVAIIAAAITATGSVTAAFVTGTLNNNSTGSDSSNPLCDGQRVRISAPSKTGAVFDLSAEVRCSPASNERYELIAEVPNVGTPGTAHTIFCPRVEIEAARGAKDYRLDISKSAVNTTRTLYVISVNPTQEKQLGENTVNDNCLLKLPDNVATVSNSIQVERNW